MYVYKHNFVVVACRALSSTSFSSSMLCLSCCHFLIWLPALTRDFSQTLKYQSTTATNMICNNNNKMLLMFGHMIYVCLYVCICIQCQPTSTLTCRSRANTYIFVFMSTCAYFLLWAVHVCPQKITCDYMASMFLSILLSIFLLNGLLYFALLAFDSVV